MRDKIEGTWISEIGAQVPFLRRYARALTGAQISGDRYALAAIESAVAEHDEGEVVSPKIALFRAFHKLWLSTGMPINARAGAGRKVHDLQQTAFKHLSKLTPNTREALLLHTIEEFTIPETALIIEQSEEDTQALINLAFDEIASHASGSVLIIEDEAMIAIDLQTIVSDMGHQIAGVATTEKDAVGLASSSHYDLILSDIRLADNSRGTDAVERILNDNGETPVIFITAYPETFLTGQGKEPAFMIPKPYTEQQVRSAVSQAMFFSSTTGMRG